MGKLLYITLLFCSIFNIKSQAQHGLTLNTHYSHFSGLNAEIGHSFSVSKKITANTRVSTNFHSAYSLRSGLSYDLIQWKKLNFTIGIEYNYESSYKRTINDIRVNDIQSHNLEFPLLIGYKLNKIIDIFGGIVPARNLNNTEDSRLIDNIRIGVMYKW